MRNLIVIFIITLAAPSQLASQSPSAPELFPETLQDMAEQAQLLMNPAALVLTSRADLALTKTQIAAIQPHADKLRGLVAEMQQQPSEIQMRAMRAMSDTTISIDEAELRETFCEQAAARAAYTVAAIESPRTIARVLSVTQRSAFGALQLNAQMKLLHVKLPSQLQQ
jgi:hypothetical protein